MKILKTIKEKWKIVFYKVNNTYTTTNHRWLRGHRNADDYEKRDNIVFEDTLQFERWGHSAKAVLKTSTGEEVTMSNTEFKKVVAEARPRIQGIFTFKNVGGQVFLRRMSSEEIDRLKP